VLEDHNQQITELIDRQVYQTQKMDSQCNEFHFTLQFLSQQLRFLEDEQ